MTMQTFTTQHGNLHFLEQGVGAPMLLLHGSTSRLQAFNPVLPALSSEYHIYAPDFRGHGKSTFTPGAYTLTDYAADIVSFIKHQIHSPTYILGSSLGGMVAILLAAHHPEWVEAIITLDPPLSMDALKKQAESQRELAMLVISYLESNNIAAIYALLNHDAKAESLSLCDPTMIRAMFDNFDAIFHAYELNSLLPRIQCPALFMRGNTEKGALISVEDEKRALQLNSTLSFTHLPTAGHSLIADDAPAVLAQLTEFMSKLPIYRS